MPVRRRLLSFLTAVAAVVVLSCGAPVGTAPPGDASTHEVGGAVGPIDTSAPGVTVRGLELDDAPSPAVAQALAAIDTERPPVPGCAKSPKPGRGGARPQLVFQDNHTDQILKMDLSADGGVLATGGVDGIVRVWDTRRGLLLRRVASGSMAFNLALSAGAEVLAVYAPTGGDLSIEAHQLQTGAKPAVAGKGMVGAAVDLMPDGSKVASVTNEVSLFNTKTGSIAGRVKLPEFAQTLSIAADGKRAAVGMTSKLGVVDLRRNKLLKAWKRSDYKELADTAQHVAIGAQHIAVQTFRGSVFAYGLDGGSGREIATATAEIAVTGNTVWTLSRADAEVENWSLKTGKRLSSLPASLVEGLTTRHIAVSADGSTLAIGGQTLQQRPIVRIIDAGSGTILRTLEGQPSRIRSLAVTDDFSRLVTGSAAGLARWDLRGARLQSITPAPVTGVAFGPDGSYVVAVATRFIEQRDAASGALARRFAAASSVELGVMVPGQHTLVTAALDGTVQKFALGPTPPATDPPPWGDVAAPPGKTVTKLPHRPEGLAVSPDGSAVVFRSSTINGTTTSVIVGLVELSTGAVRWSTKIDKADQHSTWLAVAPDGKSIYLATKQLTSTPKGDRFMAYLHVLDAKTGRGRRRERLETSGPIAFLGTSMVIGGRNPVIVDRESLRTRASIEISDTAVTAVTAVRQRGVFVLAGDSGVTSVVGATDGKVAAMLLSTADGEFVAATPAGVFSASVDGARNVGWTFARPLEGFSFDQFARVLHRPDIVAAALQGEPAAPPALLTRPPRVDLAPTQDQVAADRVTISARVSAQRWVERLRVFVNGRPVADKKVCARAKTVEIEAPLASGRNRITVIAYDAAGYASNPANADVRSTSGAHKPDLWVIASGVSTYPNMPAHLQLAFADDDAHSLTAALTKLAGDGKPFGEVKTVTLLNDGVTPANIERALAALAEMKPTDLAIVFMAGHGVRLPTGKMVFLTSDASLTEQGARTAGIGWDRIQAVLRAAKGRTILLLDACHSGHLSTELIAPNEQLAAELARDNRAGVLVFAASKGAQYSYEVGNTAGTARGLELAWEGAPQISKPPARGHGLFTSAVLEALAGDAVDRDRSGAIELTEFVDYVTERVRAASNGKQTPWVVRREMFGDYAVAPSAP